MANLRKRSQREYVGQGPALTKVCLLGRHLPRLDWILRPAWVGAGIVIDQVHFDRGCLRCTGTVERIWAPIVSPEPLVAQSQPMTLTEWLEHQVDAKIVGVPEGQVAVPDATGVVAELGRDLTP